MEDLPGSWDLLVSNLSMCDLKGVARETVDRQRHLALSNTKSPRETFHGAWAMVCERPCWQRGGGEFANRLV